MFSRNRRRLGQVWATLQIEGIVGTYKKMRDKKPSELIATSIPNPTAGKGYLDWIRGVEEKCHLTPTESSLLFSILMPVYRPSLSFLQHAIDSVLAQTYDNWELCIHDDGSDDLELAELLDTYKRDPRIKLSRSAKNSGIAAASNNAAGLATGDFIVLMDQDDTLSKVALETIASCIEANDSVKLIYSDEDKLNRKGMREGPYFKPDYNYQLLLSQNYLCHLVVINRAVFQEVDGFRPGYDGAQDHDLMLRLIEKIGPSQIQHIPSVLYHWRVHEGSTAADISTKPNALEAGRLAVRDHLARIGVNAEVQLSQIRYRVKYGLPENHDVTIIIPTRNGYATLHRCIDSILKRTNYPAYELLVVDNGSDDFNTLNYLKTLSENGVNVVVANQPFNFPALNNLAVAQCQSEFVCLLNDDTEVINPEWLAELVGHGSQPGVGCVGAKLRYPDDTIQHAGVILGIGGVAGHSHKHFSKDHEGYFSRLQVSQNLSAVTAACMLTRKSLWQQIGGMEERLAVAFNDIDFCLKLSEAGYSVVWTPWAELYHHESVSRGYEDTPEKQERFRQEVEYMMNRWPAQLARDPHYSPHLTLKNESFMLRHPSEYQI